MPVVPPLVGRPVEKRQVERLEERQVELEPGSSVARRPVEPAAGNQLAGKRPVELGKTVRTRPAESAGSCSAARRLEAGSCSAARRLEEAVGRWAERRPAVGTWVAAVLVVVGRLVVAVVAAVVASEHSTRISRSCSTGSACTASLVP